MNKGIIILLLIAVSLGFFIWSNTSEEKAIAYFGDTEIACLTNGHQRLVDHIHPVLNITVDGEPEEIPVNVGIAPNCMSEIHTHDTTGTLHIESFIAGRVHDFNLGDFFSVWGKDPAREGYDLEILQDNESKASVEDVNFIDRSVIELKYTSKEPEGE